MRKWRAVLVLAAAALGFAVSFVMLRQAIGANSPWLYLFLMFCFLGMAKIAEPLFTLRMPGRFRSIYSWERSGTVYRALGVKAFGRLLRSKPLRYLNLQVYLSRQRVDAEHVLRLVESAEASHFWAALLLLPCIGLSLATGQYWAATVFVLVQVFFNVYPILHLRLVRERLSRHAVTADCKRTSAHRSTAGHRTSGKQCSTT